MKLAFYAPMKPPDHPVPSGDRRMARSLIKALEARGHAVELAARFRSYERSGDPARQLRLRAFGDRLAGHLAERSLRRPRPERPDAWLSYHVYHKSPDHLGPVLSARLGIPYLIAEASVAWKRAIGPFAPGFADSLRALEAADLVLAMTAVDQQGLESVVRPPASLMRLPPFTDPERFQSARLERDAHRQALAVRYGLDRRLPWLLAVGMMRPDAKLCSYRRLAAALIRADRSCQLIVVGDGPARAAVEACLAPLQRPVVFTGVLGPAELAAANAACDLFVWPAVREAYGLAMLEAAAAGLPVIAGREGGVDEVVRHGRTGLLVPPGDPEAFAEAVRALLGDPVRRQRMGEAAARFVVEERSLERASLILDDALRTAQGIHRRRRGLS